MTREEAAQAGTEMTLTKREMQSVRQLVERGGSPTIKAAINRVKARRPRTLNVTLADDFKVTIEEQTREATEEEILAFKPWMGEAN